MGWYNVVLHIQLTVCITQGFEGAICGEGINPTLHALVLQEYSLVILPVNVPMLCIELCCLASAEHGYAHPSRLEPDFRMVVA